MTAKAIKPITNLKDVDARITSLVKSTKAYSTEVQTLAVSLLHHAGVHGNNQIGRVNKLLKAVQPVGGTVALARWFMKFGGYTRKEGEEGFSGWKGREFVTEHYQEGRKTLWNTGLEKQKNPLSALDADAMLKQLTARIAKAKTGAREIKSLEVSTETLDAFLKTVGGYDALTVALETPADSVEAPESVSEASNDESEAGLKDVA